MITSPKLLKQVSVSWRMVSGVRSGAKGVPVDKID